MNTLRYEKRFRRAADCLTSVLFQGDYGGRVWSKKPPSVKQRASQLYFGRPILLHSDVQMEAFVMDLLRIKSRPVFGAVLAFFLTPAAVSAASIVEEFHVTQITLDATKYNGCLIKVVPTPTAFFPSCGFGFVTLGCDGEAGPTKSAAALNLQAAQLAFVTDTKIYMRVYDSKPAGNGYCLADRVDNTKVPVP